MGFEISGSGAISLLRVFITYDHPAAFAWNLSDRLVICVCELQAERGRSLPPFIAISGHRTLGRRFQGSVGPPSLLAADRQAADDDIEHWCQHQTEQGDSEHA